MKQKPVLMVRTSERGDFLKCRQLWQWRWINRLQPIEEQPALEFGDLVHQALAAYYKPGRKRGPHPADTFELLVYKSRDALDRPFNIWADDGWTNGLHLGIAILERYVKMWEERDKEYEVISSEQTFELKIGAVGGHDIVVVGTMDGVWRHLPTGVMRFAEHKTGANIVTDALPMNEQAGTYWSFGPKWLKQKGILAPEERFDGIIYNFLRKAYPDALAHYDHLGRKLNKPKKTALVDLYNTLERALPKRPDGKIGIATIDEMIADLGEDLAYSVSEPSAVQYADFFHREMVYRGEHEATMVRHRILQQARDMILARDSPEEYVYKNPGPQFMPNCRFCPFKDMCEVHETGNHWEPMMSSLYTVWEPYSAHEKIERT